MDDKGFENSAAYVRYHHIIELLEVKTISMRQFLLPEEVGCVRRAPTDHPPESTANQVAFGPGARGEASL